MTKANSSKIKNVGIVCAMRVAFICVGKLAVVGSSRWLLYQFSAEGVSRIAVPFFFLCSGCFWANQFAVMGWSVGEVGALIKPIFIGLGLLHFGE